MAYTYGDPTDNPGYSPIPSYKNPAGVDYGTITTSGYGPMGAFVLNPSIPPQFIGLPMGPSSGDPLGDVSHLVAPNPQFALDRASLKAQLDQQLAGAFGSIDTIQNQAARSRQLTNEQRAIDARRLTGNLDERGIIGGARRTLSGELQNQYNEQVQNIALAAADQVKALQRQAANARQNYGLGLQQANINNAQFQAQYGSMFGNAPAAPSYLVAAAQQAARALGIPASWATDPALWNLLYRESGYNPVAQNRNSSAYGLFQFLNNTWAGTGYDRTADPLGQFKAGYTYIQNRYGNPENAWAFWRATVYGNPALAPPSLQGLASYWIQHGWKGY